ncbi:peroxiredoxin [Flavobacterium sp. ACN6]|uniref:peroxiredoxin family protein n=1 Tax=Flavobacterium sp. ACN6 TaxID=1920426 RepID=UPI000BB305F9|nr:redoxin domain-containing protein [Flavobacterium sp. ACN6]PBJ06637.1 thiol-disulfide oxidoreductase [Flavobacterium sp. ACN6]
MKKPLKIFLSLTVLILLSFLITKIIFRINQKNEVAKNIKIIPEFSFQDINGVLFKNRNLKENAATIFLYFNTECEFCNSETEIIQKNIEKFENIKLIFISIEQPEKIKNFAQHYQLLKYDNIHFLCDKQASFGTKFDVTALPTILIYNSQKQLIEKIKGQVKIDYLLQKIK